MLSQERADLVIGLCRDFVRTPSLSGKEDKMADVLRRAMLDLGYDEVRVDAFGNVAGTIRFGAGRKTVLFEGHMDHVPPGDLSRWSVDPYGGEVRNGKLYGRGSTDMKGNLAAMVAAAAFLKEDLRDLRTSGSGLEGAVVVAGTVHEERFEGVASAEIARTFEPDYVVIGEPTSLDLARGQRGRAEIGVTTYGVPCHSSMPEKGVNAVMQMVRLLQELRLRFQPPCHELLGKGILEVTDIISSPYPGASVLPERCSVTMDRRLLPGETEETVLGRLRELIEELGRGDPAFRAGVSVALGEDVCYTGKPIRAKRFAPAWILDDTHEFVGAALRGLQAAGLEPSLSRYSFCTNGSCYAGLLGIPTVGFGGSREELAHVVDEYIEVEELLAACRGYYGIARESLISLCR